MFAKSLIAWLLVLMLVAPAAGATDYVNIEQRLSAEQRRQTGIDSLTSEQLAALNSILRDEARNATDRDAEGGLLAQGRSLAGFDGDPIKSGISGSVSGWAPGTVFELENGQRWKVLKGEMKLRKPIVAPRIIVVPGLAGRWFLQVDEDLPKARVYRID